MTSFVFKTMPPIRRGSHSNPFVRDVESHLSPQQYNYYRGDTDTTTVHECTHGINANLRNAAMGANITPYNVQNYTLPYFAGTPDGHTRLPQPTYIDKSITHLSQKMNAFYCMDDRYVLFPEPLFRKRDVIPHIPDSQKHGIYKTYVTGQTSWDDRPLYLFDEWSGYSNGAETGAAYSITYAIQFGYFTWAVLILARQKAYDHFDALHAFFEWNIFRITGLLKTPEQEQQLDALYKHVGMP